MELLQRNLTRIIVCTLVVLFMVVDAHSENSPVGPDTFITFDRYKAFYNLSKGATRWPVWKNQSGPIVIDGQPTEEAWSHAQPIYITGEWMWNRLEKKEQPWVWQGLSDLVAVWRLVYDTNYLYVSCQFFDDFHSEGAPTERWEMTDAVEILLRHVNCAGNPLLSGTYGGTIREIRACRKFSATDSIRATVKIASGTTTRDTTLVGPDGDPRFGGLFFKAVPFCVKDRRYRGAWAMEFKIPRCAITAYGGTGSSSFKVGLKVYDDDSLSGTSTNPVLGVGMERYFNWYVNPLDTTLRLTDPLPTFYFAGIRTDDPSGFPDEFNLYCGRAASSYYDSTLALVLETCGSNSAGGGELLQNGAPFLRVLPSPLSNNGGYIRFGMPGVSGSALALYDVLGTRVVDFGFLPAGSIRWDGRNREGRPLAPGAYVLRMNAGDRTVSERILITR